MYCVKCGVELEKGRKECPLCKTKVMYEELEHESEREYPEVKINLYKMNKRKIKSRIYFIMLTLSVISILEVLLGNIAINGRLTWGYFVIPSLILIDIMIFMAINGWNLKKNLFLLSASLAIFLFILDLYDERITWSAKIGIPIVGSFFGLGLIYSRIRKQKKSKIKIFKYFLILIGIFIISIVKK